MANGDTNGGIVGAATRLSQSVVTALPPGFLLLVLLNIVFIGLVLWFLDDQLDQRTKLVGHLIDRCMDVVDKAR